MNHLRITKPFLLLVTFLTAALALLTPTTANATVWDPHVRLQGSVTCGSSPTRVTGLWLWTAQEGGRWYGYSGTRYAEYYSRDFWNVPSGGTTVYYTVYCAGFPASGAFGLQRPTFGATATRNIYYRY